ncbi:hypothetical protein F2Q69_00016050 [Brassica cretica]|uniref:Uncharacterized protein n=1 Tax=Brassica cretica TaxID=69181 RepID=A0A8S9QTU0_BRACR|nr:hypothetical protein F2Q69_00016050 [Brassica cretica]
MCGASMWSSTIEIFVECETERAGAKMEENEKNATHDNEPNDTERYEYEREPRPPCDEEARVERIVRDFVDEEVDEFATPVGSDDDQDGNEGDGYLTYNKDDIRNDPNIKPKETMEDIQKRWKLTATMDQCRHAKKRALEIIKE